MKRQLLKPDVFLGLALASALVLGGCVDGAGAKEDNDAMEIAEEGADIFGDVASPDTTIEDTVQDVEVDTVPPSASGAGYGLSSGGGYANNGEYQLTLSIGTPMASQNLKNSKYSMTIGLGSMQVGQ